MTAQMNLTDLKTVLGIKVGTDGDSTGSQDQLDVGMCKYKAHSVNGTYS